MTRFRFQAAPRVLHIGANSVLLALWFWLFHPVLDYLKIIFTHQEFRTNQIVLLAALALIIGQVRKGRLRLSLESLPQWNRPALALILGGSIGYLLVERYLDVNTFSATLFGLATYGLLGLWMQPRSWRRGLPAALLLVGALPFGDHLQTFVGYPVRVATAAVVRDGLAALGVPSVGIDTILVFETSVAKVDLPCSGVKSLWTGGLFFLAATWIEGRRIAWPWLFTALVFAGLLLAANLVRVAILVGVGQAAGLRLLADMLHVPLGVLGFVAACAAGLFLLRRFIPATDPEAVPTTTAEPDRPLWLAPVLGTLLLAMALLYTPRPETAYAQIASEWQFPAEVQAESWPLTSGEASWLAESGVKEAERWRFTWRGQNGSMLFVASTDWRAHHRPERCLEVYGLQVDEVYTDMAADDFPVRLLSLRGGTSGKAGAAYWLQSAGQITDDFAVRMWSDLAPERERWVLATVLFDQNQDPGSEDALDLYTVLRQVIEKSFAMRNNPGGMK